MQQFSIRSVCPSSPGASADRARPSDPRRFRLQQQQEEPAGKPRKPFEFVEKKHNRRELRLLLLVEAVGKGGAVRSARDPAGHGREV
jgi:hypothetical protein